MGIGGYFCNDVQAHKRMSPHSFSNYVFILKCVDSIYSQINRVLYGMSFMTQPQTSYFS